MTSNPYVATGDIRLSPRDEPITFSIHIADPARLAALDAVELADWERDLEANLYVQLIPHVRSLPPSREVERNAEGRIVRLVDYPADPPADVRAASAARGSGARDHRASHRTCEVTRAATRRDRGRRKVQRAPRNTPSHLRGLIRGVERSGTRRASNDR